MNELESKPVLRTVAISLGDNDYGSTFKPLLESIYQLAACVVKPMLQERMTRAIYEGIRYHYAAFQRDERYNPDTAEEDITSTVKYLTDGIKILFDEDAERDVLENDHDGGAWYIELQDPAGIAKYY